MAGHTILSTSLKKQLEANDIAGIRICKNIKIVEVQSGGPQNLGASSRDCQNYISERRRLRLSERRCKAIHNLFSTLQKKDPRFFHLMDLDDDLRLRNVMWTVSKLKKDPHTHVSILHRQGLYRSSRCDGATSHSEASDHHLNPQIII